MPNNLSGDTMRRLARLGARARLDELDAERSAILSAFPDLRVQRAGRRAAPAKAQAMGATKPVRRRRRMNAAERKEVSERMKRYWAERRKAKK